ncbi:MULTISPECIES: stage II sporulation protein R [Bacillaceae]|uniref:Stage II sporulation protein R n=1 Tax=Evansella alkalicola TaxID=745819 RepID=A0ABS6K0I5_9BACI|nr:MULTISPECIES: stage II sporulation protein R [Bacillaceae]MBU9724361.1 stage II sporulation protein R [Bacillus alkalicola]
MKQRIHIYIFLSLSVLLLSWEANLLKPVQADEILIPEESIRLRILANSNSPIDQQVKHNIRNAVNAQITEWVELLDDVDDARDIIGENIDDLNSIVGEELEKVGNDESYNVSLTETSFPTKLYGDRLYPAGDYEAVLIELGDGQGDNWWCVLFPPLCFLDFSNGDAVAHEADETPKEEENEEEVEVSFFIVEIFTSIVDRFKA